MTRRTTWAIAFGVGCFGLGLAAAQLRWTSGPAPAPTDSNRDGRAPRILLDPAAIDLLPDGGLFINWSALLDAGSP